MIISKENKDQRSVNDINYNNCLLQRKGNEGNIDTKNFKNPKD